MTAPNANANLGAARGSIQIDTSDLSRVQATAQSVGQNVARSLGQINSAAQGAQGGLRGLRDTFSSVDNAAGALAGGLRGLGAAAGAAGLVALGAAAVHAAGDLAQLGAQAERLETSFANVAARAGQSGQQMLESMRKASRGTISDTDLMLNANRAMLLGVADTAEEMGKLLEVARVRGAAFGLSTSQAFGDIVTGLGRLSPMILDNLGITVDADRTYAAYASTLGKTADQLSDAEKRQALLNRVLEDTQPLIDAAGDAADSNADKLERFGTAWQNMTAQMGRNIADNVTEITDALSGLFEWITRLAGMGSFSIPAPTISPAAGAGASAPVIDIAARNREIMAHTEAVAEIESDARRNRMDAIRDYEQRVTEIVNEGGQRRADTIRQYELTIARDAEDFARQRVRQWADLEASIARINRDRARQEIALRADLDERLTELREESTKRIAEIEEDAQRDRERRERSHRNRLLDAAARLDAVALLQEQRQFADEEQERKQDLDERIRDEKENLAERVDKENEAHQVRIDEARRADEQRIADMRTALAEQQQREDEDRALRLTRMAEDHQDQLDEMARAQAQQLQQLETTHAQRLEQINRHEADELRAEQNAHLQRLADLGIYNEGWKIIQDARQREALKAWDQFWIDFNRRFALQGPAPRPTTEFPLMNDPYRGWSLADQPAMQVPPALQEWLRVVPSLSTIAPVLPTPGIGGSTPIGGNTSTITIESGAISVTVAGTTNMSEAQMKMVAREAFIEALEEVNP